jgi:hypothetical protein
MSSRRSFLRSGTLTAVSLGIVAATGRLGFGQGRTQNRNPGFQIPYSELQNPLLYYKQSAFENCIGSTFSIDSNQGSARLILVAVTGYTPNPNTQLSTKPARACESFSLLFSASGALPTSTTVYTVNHMVLGTFDLFLTPGASQNGVRYYQAVINHL